jgi:hypothetical protein
MMKPHANRQLVKSALQLERKKRLSAADFLNSNREIIGS